MTTRPTPDPTPGSDEELHALFRAGRAAAEPPPALDRAILAAAREAAASSEDSRSPAKRSRPRPWWQTWLAPVSLVLVAVVGLSLSVRIAEDPAYERLDVAPRPAVSPPAPSSVATPPAPTAASAAHPSPALERKSVAAPAGRPAPAEATTQTAAEAFLEERAVRQKREAASAERAAAAAQSVVPSASGGRAAEREAPAVVPPPPRAGLMKAAPEADALRDAPAPKAAAPVPEAAKPARRESIGSTAATLKPTPTKESAGVVTEAAEAAKAADPAVSPSTVGGPHAPSSLLRARPSAPADDIAAREADPVLWLAAIRKLRLAGREDEAAAELERFRKRHPGHPIPADLLRR